MFWSETDKVRLQASIRHFGIASGLLFCWKCYASRFWQNHWQNLLVIYEHIFSSSPRPAMARDCIDSRLLPMARHKRKEGISLAPVLKEEEAGLNIWRWRRKTKYDLKYTKTNRFYTKKRLWSRVTCHISHVSAPQSPKDWLLNGWGWQIKWVMDNVRAFFLNCIIFPLLFYLIEINQFFSSPVLDLKVVVTTNLAHGLDMRMQRMTSICLIWWDLQWWSYKNLTVKTSYIYLIN